MDVRSKHRLCQIAAQSIVANHCAKKFLTLTFLHQPQTQFASGTHVIHAADAQQRSTRMALHLRGTAFCRALSCPPSATCFLKDSIPFLAFRPKMMVGRTAVVLHSQQVFLADGEC
jgi:hypothetical protein